MSVRVAIAVALAVALLGASLPAIEDARIQHGEARVVAALDRLEGAASVLAAENAAVDGVPARTTLTLHLPSRSWGHRGLETLRVPAVPTDPIRWRLRGGDTHTRRPSPPLVGPGVALKIGGGRHRLVLSLRHAGGRRQVAVRPASTHRNH